MSEQSARERAELLSQMAPHSSVRTSVLMGDETGFPEGRLTGEPPVTYLEETEAPAFILTNSKRGVAVGTKRNQTTPDDDRGTVILVTGRRTLCLVGAEPTDQRFEVTHPSVAAVSYHTGFLANRLEIRTSRRVVHCWVARGTDEALLEETASYVRNRMGKSLEEITEDGEQAGEVTYRGEALDHAENGQTAANDDEQVEEGDDDSQVMYRGRPVDGSYYE